MMGYAHSPADLALGQTVDDTAHRRPRPARRPTASTRWSGRTSRFVKMYGLRIDLQRVETALRERGMTAVCADDDERLVVAASDHRRALRRRSGRRRAAGLPAAAVRVRRRRRAAAAAVGQAGLSGRPRAGATHRGGGARRAGSACGCSPTSCTSTPPTIDPRASFVDLGGNSLSYVTMSVRLERALGHLPADWQRLSLRELEGIAQAPTRRWGTTLETSVALRAVAIVLVVGSHAELFTAVGRGAHPARRRRLQLRPVLPDPLPRARPGPPPAQHHRVDRGARRWCGSPSRW